MKIHLALYGTLREVDPRGWLELEVAEAATVADLRAALVAYLESHTSNARASVVERSAFASRDSVLRETSPLPAGVELAVLPPVSGG
ncbi:MAG: thiamine biosynthesis protein ThiS [Rhodanobacter sp.]|nr:MAG: thiamine biosynthesis protein ThiS [Rhodanobacter sp.]TAM10858.1 MAG: thiamine biosynthesis protein ThiS [Rhodanobacter sp.]TAM35213.1 MAG: thiamine biosynthesis protein ThiS [Rhodanobacter sp.]